MGAIAEVNAAVEALTPHLVNACQIVAVTGAGASAASGIPTYRGAGGSWTRYDPDRYASIQGFEAEPEYYWRFYIDERYPALAAARPNPVHHALAALERAGKLTALVTQNIDGLHRAAGSKRIFELHGNSRRFYCQGCDRELDFETVRRLVDHHVPPHCPDCEVAQIRPDVVFFGEGLPAAVLAEAEEQVVTADLVLVVGSSLVVQPAATLPRQGVEAGARLIILNMDPTPLDPLATALVCAPADQVLPAALDALGIEQPSE